MARQVFQQPNGLFSLFSTVTDTFIVEDISEKDLIENMAAEAADETRCLYKGLIDKAKKDEIPFLGLTWKEAKDLHDNNTRSNQ